MAISAMRGYHVLTALLLFIPACKSELRYRVVAAPESPQALGPLEVEVAAIDTAELGENHPFRWQGDSLAGFMLFEVKTKNPSKRDLLCLVGHVDFPGFVEPQVRATHLLEGASSTSPSSEPQLVGGDDLRIARLAHEKATVLAEDGNRYQILGHSEFTHRYVRIMRQEMKRARGWMFVPYVGPFIAGRKIEEAEDDMEARQLRAEQKVLRPGIVPADSTVRGYLVFAWPEDLTHGGLTLRLPVQPAHAMSFKFQIVEVDRTKQTH